MRRSTTGRGGASSSRPGGGMRPGRRRRVSMRQVATEAGVSVATVSLALNHSDRISDATREHVTAVATRLGYQFHRTGRSRPLGRTIAVAIPVNGPLFADAALCDLMSGIVASAARFDYDVLIASAHARLVHHTKPLPPNERRTVDGVLLLGVPQPHPYLNQFTASDAPIVAINDADTPAGDRVLSD